MEGRVYSRLRPVNYRSVADLNAATRRMASDLAGEVDLIVGVPRSGLLASNLLCLHCDLPMTDVDGLCDGRLLDTGLRYDGGVSAVGDADRVLVVDDTVNSGRQITETKARLGGRDFPFEIDYAAVYVSFEGDRFVDYWAEVVPNPRVFEWNVMHHPQLENWCVDVDGVLCREPTAEEGDDGDRYREFVSSVEPRFVPSKEIGWLVTCWPEEYREPMEAWLDGHGIEYGELLMSDLPDPETRRSPGTHAQFKARAYQTTGAEFFVESSARQAEEIATLSGEPVYCVEANRVFRPGALRRTTARGRRYVSGLSERPVSTSRATGEVLLKRCRYHLRRARDAFFGE